MPCDGSAFPPGCVLPCSSIPGIHTSSIVTRIKPLLKMNKWIKTLPLIWYQSVMSLLKNFSHTSVQNSFSSNTLAGFQKWRDHFMSYPIIPIWFKSGFWVGHSKIFFYFLFCHVDFFFYLSLFFCIIFIFISLMRFCAVQMVVSTIAEKHLHDCLYEILPDIMSKWFIFLWKKALVTSRWFWFCH